MPSEALAKEGLKVPPTDFAGLAPNTQSKQDAIDALEMEGDMQYVYLLENSSADPKRYVGITSDIQRRLSEHNAGKSRHTAKFGPWRLVTYVAFSDGGKAAEFEHYLKSGSGHAFARKRLW